MKAKTNTDIRQAMKDAGMSYADLAAIAGKSEPTVYRQLAADLTEEERAELLRCIEIYKAGGQTVQAVKEGTDGAEPAQDPHKVKTEAELLAMMEAIKNTQRSEAEDEARKEIIIKMGEIDRRDAEALTALLELRKKYGQLYELPNEVRTEMSKLKDERERCAREKAELQRRFTVVSDALLQWEQSKAERRAKLEELKHSIQLAEAAMKAAETARQYDAFKTAEKSVFEMKSSYSSLLDEDKNAMKPDCRHAIEKAVTDFQRENRRALLDQLRTLAAQMRDIIGKAELREVEMAQYSEHFMQAPFTQPNRFLSPASLVHSYYEQFSDLTNSQALR